MNDLIHNPVLAMPCFSLVDVIIPTPTFMGVYYDGNTESFVRVSSRLDKRVFCYPWIVHE